MPKKPKKGRGYNTDIFYRTGVRPELVPIFLDIRDLMEDVMNRVTPFEAFQRYLDHLDELVLSSDNPKDIERFLRMEEELDSALKDLNICLQQCITLLNTLSTYPDLKEIEQFVPHYYKEECLEDLIKGFEDRRNDVIKRKKVFLSRFEENK